MAGSAGPRSDGDEVGAGPRGDERLSTRDHVLVTIAHRAGGDGPDIRAGPGLGHTQDAILVPVTAGRTNSSSCHGSPAAAM